MEINTSLIAEIKAIIAASRENAIKAVDNERVLIYWQIGKRILKKSSKEKNVQIMENT